MAHIWKVTAKINIGGSKGIKKGQQVQVASVSSGHPLEKEISEAFKNQLGIDIRSSETSYVKFQCELIKKG